MGMFTGAFVRGHKILVGDLLKEELEDEGILEVEGIKKRELQFEAANLDAAVARALKSQQNYNKGSLRDAIRYIFVKDSRGNRRNLFDLG
jgi:hypothetical protein